MLDKYGFDKWSGNYDESLKPLLNKFPFDGYYKVLSTVISLVCPAVNLKVLDVGIGTGLLSEELHNQGCIIHGVDFSKKMIEKAKQKIQGGDFETCDVASNHFGKFNSHKYHAVISSYFIHHLNIAQKTQFIKRTLEENLLPNGKIIIADVGFATEQEFEKAHIKHQKDWDEDEFYLCGESIVSHLGSDKIKSEYNQISSCAGILTCNK